MSPFGMVFSHMGCQRAARDFGRGLGFTLPADYGMSEYAATLPAGRTGFRQWSGFYSTGRLRMVVIRSDSPGRRAARPGTGSIFRRNDGPSSSRRHEQFYERSGQGSRYLRQIQPGKEG